MTFVTEVDEESKAIKREKPNEKEDKPYKERCSMSLDAIVWRPSPSVFLRMTYRS